MGERAQRVHKTSICKGGRLNRLQLSLFHNLGSLLPFSQRTNAHQSESVPICVVLVSRQTGLKGTGCQTCLKLASQAGT